VAREEQWGRERTSGTRCSASGESDNTTPEENTKKQEPQQAETAKPVSTIKPDKTPIVAGAEIAAIVPRAYEDAYRISVAFVKAGMVPESFLIKRGAQGKEVKAWEDGSVDEQGTCARVSLGKAWRSA